MESIATAPWLAASASPSPSFLPGASSSSSIGRERSLREARGFAQKTVRCSRFDGGGSRSPSGSRVSCGFGSCGLPSERTSVERRVSCGLGSPLVSTGARPRSSGALAAAHGLAGLFPEADSRLGAGALAHRRALRVARRLSSEENSEATVEQATEELEKQAEESKAAYNEAVDVLKDQTNKLQDSPSAERAIEVLRDTTDKLREEAEKARAILTATAFETAELGKSNLNLLAESAPDPIKGIAESAVNAHLKDTTRQGAKIHDFCLGIPYGAFLVTGGLLWFIVTGSTAAIRFGVILGGLLLFLSVRSLKAWKEGRSSMRYIQGQAAVALIIFVKDVRKFLETGPLFPPVLSALASGGILAFYAYVYLSGGNPPKKEKIAETSDA